MKIEVEVTKTKFFTLLGAFLVLTSVVFVVAYNNPPLASNNPALIGHSVDEVDWDQDIGPGNKVQIGDAYFSGGSGNSHIARNAYNDGAIWQFPKAGEGSSLIQLTPTDLRFFTRVAEIGSPWVRQMTVNSNGLQLNNGGVSVYEVTNSACNLNDIGELTVSSTCLRRTCVVGIGTPGTISCSNGVSCIPGSFGTTCSNTFRGKLV